MSHFQISLGGDDTVRGEYKTGQHIAIFSHGFDVKRDSGGLFHDIAGSLPEGFGYVLFDYHAHAGPTETLRPLSEQARILDQVIAWTRQHLQPLSLHLVAHSMGCTVASYNGNTSFDTVIFLAPPLRTGSGLRQFFTNHRGATHYGDFWEIQRRSGKITRVNEKFFKDIEAANPEAFIKAYAAHVPLTVIAAAQDKFISAEHYNSLKNHSGVRLLTIEGDHNFNDPARQGLLETLKNHFQSKKH